MQNTTHLGCPNRFTYAENTIGNLQKALTAKFLGSDRLNIFLAYASLTASKTFLAIITSLSELYVRSWKFRLRFRRFPETLQYWVCVQQGQSYLMGRRCLQGEGASLSLVGHPSTDGVTRKIPYEVDILLNQPAFSYWVG